MRIASLFNRLAHGASHLNTPTARVAVGTAAGTIAYLAILEPTPDNPHAKAFKHPTAWRLPASVRAPRPKPPQEAQLPAGVIATDFGLEIETTMAVAKGQEVLAATGVPLQQSDGASYSGWQVVHDGGAELISPVLNRDSYPDVAKVINGLRAQGNVVSGSSRGLHIHLRADDLSADTLLHIIHVYYNAEGVWQRMVGSSAHRVSMWCSHLEKSFLAGLAATRPDSVEGIMQVWGDTVGSRYRGLNLEAWHKHKTLELRMFEASDDMEYVDGCIGLAQRLVTTAKERKTFTDWESFAQPAARAQEAEPVLEALGFATSNAGLQYLRRRLLATYAQHPLIPEHSYARRASGMRHPTPFLTDPHPFSRACASGDLRKVTNFLGTATVAELRDSLQRGNNGGFRAAALRGHAKIVAEIIRVVHERLGAEAVDALCATHNFSLFSMVNRDVYRVMTAWSDSRSERYRCGVHAGEGWGTFDGDPQAAMAHYDATHAPSPTPLAPMVLRALEVLSAMG